MGLEDQTAEHVLQTCRPLLQTAEQMYGQQQSRYTPNSDYGSEEKLGKTGHVHLADRTLSVAATEKKVKAGSSWVASVDQSCLNHDPDVLCFRLSLRSFYSL